MRCSMVDAGRTVLNVVMLVFPQSHAYRPLLLGIEATDNTRHACGLPFEIEEHTARTFRSTEDITGRESNALGWTENSVGYQR